MKTKKQCQNCKSWKKLNTRNNGMGLCSSEKRKAQKNIPLFLDYRTFCELKDCDFWEARK